MAEPLLLYLAIGGLAISAFSTALLYTAFQLVGLPIRLSVVYVLFTLTFALLVAGFYDPIYAAAAPIAETLAFFVIYLDYFRKEILLAATPAIAVGGTIAYVLSLYFLVYNSILILRQRRTERYSLFVFGAFVVFLASVVLAMLTLVDLPTDLTAYSYLLLDVGVALFFVPLFVLGATARNRARA